MVAWTVELGIVVNLHSAVFVDSDMRQFMRVFLESERAFELQQGQPGGGEGGVARVSLFGSGTSVKTPALVDQTEGFTIRQCSSDCNQPLESETKHLV